MTRVTTVLPALLLALLACNTAERTPWVKSTYPTDGAVDVPTNTRVRVTFSEPVDTASVAVAFSIAPAVEGSFEWGDGCSTMYWQPVQNLAGQTQYTFAVETPATNVSGRGLTKRLSVSFTTGDAAAVTVLSTYPTAGATGIPTNVDIRVGFSEEMDTASARAAFSLTPQVAGFPVWIGNNMYWLLTGAMAPQTTYTFAVDTTARSASGHRIGYMPPVTFTTGDTAVTGAGLIMMGRSVMGGWFSHWGGSPFEQGRFWLRYHEVRPPPDIVASAFTFLDTLVFIEPPVVFFKLCFVDFEGGDSASAQANLARNVGYVRSVYATARQYHFKMAVGNALPQLANATDPWLVWNHRQYNQRLLDLAAQHADSLAVFDMYSVLSDAAGNLRPDYATGPDDSHPNDAGYTALDSASSPSWNNTTNPTGEGRS